MDFEWRSDVGQWRWLILSVLGVAPGACGGRTGIDSVPSGERLEHQGGPAERLQPPVGTSAGGAAGAFAGTAGTTVVVQPAEPVSYGGTNPVLTPGATSVASPCQNAREVGGGWLFCDNGMLHRATVGVCQSKVPRARRVMVPPEYTLYQDAGALTTACREDSDCTAEPYGHCDWGAVPVEGSYCSYGCVVDADCSAGQVCLCGDPVGQCVAAECATDAECGAGQLCVDFVPWPGCGGIEFACQTAKDECAAEGDCAEGLSCTLNDYLDNYLNGDPNGAPSHRICSPPTCQSGRPFLIFGRERLASPMPRSDWCLPAGEGRTPSGELDPRLRAELVRGWTEQALMEHASVAAFARFSLQLLSLQAPPDLVLRAADAIEDEIRHARACFGLAREYSGCDVGPGPLVIEGALDESDLCSVVLAAIAEGCIGETVAALEAAEALAHAEDAKVRAVLTRIAIEESRHAELAWQFVAWALFTAPVSLSERARGAFEAALASPSSDTPRPSPFERELLRHGLLSTELRRSLRGRVLCEVIAPCARALFERLPLAAELGEQRRVTSA